MFSKADHAQRAKQALLADAAAAQPASPQPLTTKAIVAESPSPVLTPNAVDALSHPAASQLTTSQVSSPDSAIEVEQEQRSTAAESTEDKADTHKLDCRIAAANGVAECKVGVDLAERQGDAQRRVEEPLTLVRASSQVDVQGEPT